MIGCWVRVDTGRSMGALPTKQPILPPQTIAACALPLIGKIDESKITDRKRLPVTKRSLAFETGVLNGIPVLVRTTTTGRSDIAFEAEYRLFVRIRNVPQAGYIIGYCDNQTLVFGFRDKPGEVEFLYSVISGKVSAMDKTERLLRWVELAMKIHALDPRMFTVYLKSCANITIWCAHSNPRV